MFRVDEVQPSEVLSAQQGVIHEIRRPTLVGLFRLLQDFQETLGQASLFMNAQVELHGAGHPIGALVIPAVSLMAQLTEQLGEAPVWLRLCPLLQRGYQYVVIS